MNACIIAFSGLLIAGGPPGGKPTSEAAIQLLRNVRAALEAKEYGKAVAFLQPSPAHPVRAEDLKKMAPRFLELGWFAKERVDLLAKKGNWCTYKEAIDKAPETLAWGDWEAREVPNQFKVSPDACHVLVLKGEVGAMFHWDGKRFKLLHYEDREFGERRFVEHCVKEIDTGEASAKAMGFDILGNMGPKAKSAAPAMSKLLKHEDSYMRVRAAWVLWRVDSRQEGMPVLLEAMKDKKVSPTTRALAADALGWFGPKAKSTVPALTEVLKDDDPKCAMLRVNAAWALWKVDRQTKEARAGLTRVLKEKDLEAFRTAVRAFEEIGMDREAIASLGEVLKRDETWRYWGQGALRPLQKALKEGGQEVRREAVSALVLLGPGDAVAVLNGLLKDEDLEIRKGAAEGLKKIEAKQPPHKK
jgi:hypothetical protein